MSKPMNTARKVWLGCFIVCLFGGGVALYGLMVSAGFWQWLAGFCLVAYCWYAGRSLYLIYITSEYGKGGRLHLWVDSINPCRCRDADWPGGGSRFWCWLDWALRCRSRRVCYRHEGLIRGKIYTGEDDD